MYDELRTTTGKSGKINGATYKGKNILILRNGKIEYSTEHSNARYVNEFKDLLRKADAEHRKTPAVIVERHTNDDVSQEAMDNIIENVGERIESEIDIQADLAENNVEITRGSLNVKYDDLIEVEDDNLIDVKIEALDKEKDHWEAKAVEERENGNNNKALPYEAMSKVAELKADELRLRTNQQPKGERVMAMVREEADENDLTRFERFKKWARETWSTGCE